MDNLLLSALSTKQRYNSLKHVVPQGMVAPDTLALLQWYGAYYGSVLRLCSHFSGDGGSYSVYDIALWFDEQSWLYIDSL